MVIADLTMKSIQVCLPISEHLPFDLIAVGQDMQLSRIQCKYRSKDKRGGFEVPLRTTHSDSRGVHHGHLNTNEFDAFAVFCPETEKVYYIPIDRFKDIRNVMRLRIDPLVSKKGSAHVKMAEDFLEVDVIFRA